MCNHLHQRCSGNCTPGHHIHTKTRTPCTSGHRLVSMASFATSSASRRGLHPLSHSNFPLGELVSHLEQKARLIDISNDIALATFCMELIYILLAVFILFKLIQRVKAQFSPPKMVSKEIINTVQQAIKSHEVFVASKSYCPYCQASLKTFDQLGVKPYVLQLNQMDEGSEIQSYLRELTGQSTVPNIFIGGKHIGGNSDLQELKLSGELKKLLKL